MTPSLKAEIEQALGIPLGNGYGMTEMGPTICQTPTHAPRTDCAVGPPIAGVETRVVDDSGSDVGSGQVGESWVRGPNLMKGYYGNEQQTREAISAEGWLNTGDLARRGDDGALHIVGRTKELIIRSGFNVYPVEVEHVLNSYPGVVQSAVVGRAVGHNEEVIAFVEPVPGTMLDDSRLREYVRERLSPYKVPSEIRFLAKLPSAPSGKVLKSVLNELARQKLDDPMS